MADERRTGGPRSRGRPGGRSPRAGRARTGRDHRDRADASASSRILAELPALEKALSTGDFSKQKLPLEQLQRALRPLRLSSLEHLDFNTRGRLLTTLLRVGRQKKPPEPTVAKAAPTEGEQAATAEVMPTAPGEDDGQARSSATPSDAPVGEGVPPPPSARAPSPEEEKWAAYREVMFLVGSVWRAVGDEGRAAPAFAASGRSPEASESPSAEASAAKGVAPSDWREQAQRLESAKKDRDAARLHERHGSQPEAGRLYEKSGDLTSALRSFLAGKDEASARRVLRQLKPGQFLPLIEKTRAFPLLMEHYVEMGRFDEVAKLYERARQFDQAGIAWERAGKLGAARKAYERAKDGGNAERVRQLEVAKLIERGDRFGAAVLLASAGKREEATHALAALPAAKAFRFLQKLRLNGEALSLAQQQIARAEAENLPAESARWLEMLGEASAAAEAWIRAERKDRALTIYEKAGEWQRAAPLAEALGQRDKAVELYQRAGDKTSADRVAAMPAPVVSPPPSTAPVALEGEGEEG